MQFDEYNNRSINICDHKAHVVMRNWIQSCTMSCGYKHNFVTMIVIAEHTFTYKHESGKHYIYCMYVTKAKLWELCNGIYKLNFKLTADRSMSIIAWKKCTCTIYYIYILSVTIIVLSNQSRHTSFKI